MFSKINPYHGREITEEDSNILRNAENNSDVVQIEQEKVKIEEVKSFIDKIILNFDK